MENARRSKAKHHGFERLHNTKIASPIRQPYRLSTFRSSPTQEARVDTGNYTRISGDPLASALSRTSARMSSLYKTESWENLQDWTEYGRSALAVGKRSAQDEAALNTLPDGALMLGGDQRVRMGELPDTGWSQFWCDKPHSTIQAATARGGS
jgi:hypothetical protein